MAAMDPSRSPRTSPKSPRRMTNPQDPRILSAIIEDPSHAQTARPASRWSGGTWSNKSRANTLPRVSSDHLPPPYARFGPAREDLNEGEKAGSARNYRYMTKRGGWGKLCVILLVVLLIIIGLAVGLGVGLTRHKSSSSSASDTPAPAAPSAASLAFPIGSYSLVTVLNTVRSNCTSNSATWRCYPYATYSSANPTAAEATFNWVLSNTSATYVTNSTMTTTDSTGIPANITISAADDPFGIAVSNQSVTYINNASNPHYIFSFTQSKSTIPTVALTSNNVASQCFFNQTQFTATLYLSGQGSSPTTDYPSENSTPASSGGYTAWPYAIDVQQISGGGADVPACYETNNGAVGDRITGIFTTEAADDQCLCDYRNYGL